jgi:MoaA/NifB/PqqE/SkfB family radical SAM enzyme
VAEPAPDLVPKSPALPGAAPVHDFLAKLRQPSVKGQVDAYVRWQQDLRAGRADPRSIAPTAPISINLDLTTACNYACDHCIDWDQLNTPSKHEDARLRLSIEAMVAGGLRSVILIGGGEPTLYPGFADFVRFLKGLALQVAVVSNGSRNERLLAVVKDLDDKDWIRLSLDSGSNATFVAMHKPSNKALTLDEICSWIPKLKQVNAAPRVGFSFIITWKGASREDTKVIENLGEIELAAERARDAGFDYIAYKPFLMRAETGSEVLDPTRVEQELAAVIARIKAGIEVAKRLERPGFRVVESTNLRVLLAGSWRKLTQQPHTCHMQALRQVLTPQGVYNCPAYRGVPYARLGDKDLWAEPAAAGKATANLLTSFDAADRCKEVTCLYNSTNWWLEDLIESQADPSALPAADERLDHFL